jgi:antitoxin MazE
MLTTKITRYGNSLAVRLPAALARELELREGDNVIIKRSGSGIVFERAYRGTLEEMLATVQGEPEGELLTGPALGAEDFD